MSEFSPQCALTNWLVAMNTRERNWSLVVLRKGKPAEAVQLATGATTLGRDQSNTIVLPDASVSRQHAEIVVSAGGVVIRDLKSHNGTRVNGVPRLEAHLQAGDRIEVGDFTFELAAAGSGETTLLSLQQVVVSASQVEQTLDERPQLPDSPQERQLAALYHVCFWVAEGVDEKAFVPRCLRLLREALHAQEVQLYDAGLQLEAFVGEDARRPSVKLADYLARRFQEAPEATTFLGRELAQHQQRVGQFNFLVGPLRANAAAPRKAPFLVLLRPGDWNDFTAGERVLLQAICQLWARGLVKANQVQALRQENASLKRKVSPPALLGSSAVMEQLRAQAAKAAALNVTILLTGETGSGKEVLAQFIHENSPWRHGPFVKVNCAAIPESLIESELFGHVRGAFTGAQADRKGKFLSADGGTLFLDEVGELPLAAQAKLLRAIETCEIEPVGADQPTQVKARIIAATNRDLEAMTREGRFRQDLFLRLNVVNLRAPPLREHLEDLAELAAHFLEKFCSVNGLAAMEWTPEALTALQEYAWPGNVRELRSLVQRCALAAVPPRVSARVVEEQLGALKR
jgi:pSer/pThr/pTyr-binding forkhead associated (FHA) protein